MSLKHDAGLALLLAWLMAGVMALQSPARGEEPLPPSAAVLKLGDGFAPAYSPITLLTSPNIQRELAMFRLQADRAASVVEVFRRDLRAAHETAPPTDELLVDAVRLRAVADLVRLLNEVQYARLEEIQLQVIGDNALLRPDIQRRLGLRPEQVQALVRAQFVNEKARISLDERRRNEFVTEDAFYGQLWALREVNGARLRAVLTPEQVEVWEAMKGEAVAWAD